MRTLLAVLPLTLLLTACPCTEVGCGLSLDLEPRPYSGDARGGTVTVCQNDECFDASVESEPARIAAGPFFVSLAGAGGSRSADLEGSLQSRAVEDGDRDRLELVAADGTVLVADEWTVRYEPYRPNGPTCEPECARGTGTAE